MQQQQLQEQLTITNVSRHPLLSVAITQTSLQLVSNCNLVAIDFQLQSLLTFEDHDTHLSSISDYGTMLNFVPVFAIFAQNLALCSQ